MGSHEDTVRTLEVELGRVQQGFGELGEEQWRTPTRLRPLDEAKPPAQTPDDLAWVRAASGRAEHPDPRLPLIG